MTNRADISRFELQEILDNIIIFMKIFLFNMFRNLEVHFKLEEASVAANLNHDFLSYLKIKTILLMYLMVYYFRTTVLFSEPGRMSGELMS